MRPLLLPNNRDWLGAFTGVLLQLTYPYNWQQLNEEDMTPEEAAAYSQAIIDDYFNEQGDCDMNCCEPPLTRVNSEGVVQTSTDGGTTWVDTPSADPRQTSMQFQPLGGADGDTKRCKAAENVARAFEDDVDQLVAELGVYTSYAGYVLAITAIVVVVLSAGAFLPAVAALATATIGLGAAGLAATMTTEVYDRFKCNLYCHMSEAGTLSDSDIALIKAQILEDEATSGAAEVLTQLVNNYGRVGLNNLATLQGAGDGDTCEECNCDGAWCWFADFMGAVSQGFENYDGTGTGTGFLGADGWTAGVDAPNSTKYVHARLEFDLTTVTRVTFNYSLNPDDCGGGANNVQMRLFLEGTQIYAVGHVVDATETDANWAFEFDPVVCDMIDIGLECGCFEPYGTGSIHSVQMEGFGEPVGTDNCED